MLLILKVCHGWITVVNEYWMANGKLINLFVSILMVNRHKVSKVQEHIRVPYPKPPPVSVKIFLSYKIWKKTISPFSPWRTDKLTTSDEGAEPREGIMDITPQARTRVQKNIYRQRHKTLTWPGGRLK